MPITPAGPAASARATPQFMTAGGGVMHSEMPGPGGVQSRQLWLNLPARLKRVVARYQNVLRSDAPAYAQEGVEARVYAGRLGDIVVAHASTWPMTLIDLKMAPGAAFDAPIPAGQRTFAYVLEGEVALGAEKRQAKAGDVAWAHSFVRRRRRRRAAGARRRRRLGFSSSRARSSTSPSRWADPSS